jgi:multimeric flavodoxin WrbA
MKMRILAISASPRRGGNSDAAARRALELLGDAGQTRFVRVSDYRIEHCRGCRECMKIMRCAIAGDDFERLFDEWKAADALIVSAPVYWLGPPGAMKDFIDRTHGVYAHRTGPFAGKSAAVISVATESGFEPHEAILCGWLAHYGAEIVGKVRLLAREKTDLVNSPPELRKLDEFVGAVRAKLAKV